VIASANRQRDDKPLSREFEPSAQHSSQPKLRQPKGWNNSCVDSTSPTAQPHASASASVRRSGAAAIG
jgi:hypothetical protein